MRTIYNHKIVLVSLFMLMAFTTSAPAQNYIEALDAVWITNTTTQYTEELVILTNEQILSQDKFKLNKEIRQAEKDLDNQNSVNKGVSELSRYEYLKTLRRAANRTDNEADFKEMVMDALPVLQPIFSNLDHMDHLYDAVRKDTFNGRLEALPSVL